MDSYEKAAQAIGEMFGDASWSKEECIDNLESLKDDIEILLSSLGAQPLIQPLKTVMHSVCRGEYDKDYKHTYYPE